MAQKQVTVMSRQVTIEGDEGDLYFRMLEQFAPQCDRLGELAAREAGAGGIVVDAGANIGLTTIALALAAPVARVVAFEPSPVNLAFLRKNLQANGLDRVEVVDKALSDRETTLRFLEAKGFGAGSHVAGPDHLDPKVGSLEIQATTLDTLFPDGSPPVRFMKIDCEGHEPEVVFGGRELLARDRPLLAMEFNSWTLNGCAGHSPAAFADALWQHFKPEALLMHDKSVPPPPSAFAFLHMNLTQHGCVSDIVFRPKPDFALRRLTDLTLPPSLRALLRDP